jgi:hypothetical protein
MFRQVFIPTEPQYIAPPIPIPQEWYGREVVLSAVPAMDKIVDETEDIEERAKIAKWRKLFDELNQKFSLDPTDFDGFVQRMKELDDIHSRYPTLDLTGYKFNRDEANDYD